MRLLLDVNVWIALFDDAHLFSPAANALFDMPKLQIATCPLVENAVIRILNLPSYARIGPVGFERVRAQLKQVCQAIDHQFWPDDLSLRDDVLDFARITGHNQITDAYLLALAVKRDGALASFDQAVALSAVKGASAKNLRLL
jgi:uncharacterized protein